MEVWVAAAVHRFVGRHVHEHALPHNSVVVHESKPPGKGGNGKDAAAYHSDVHDAEDASEDGERQGDDERDRHLAPPVQRFAYIERLIDGCCLAKQGPLVAKSWRRSCDEVGVGAPTGGRKGRAGRPRHGVR